MRWGAVQPEQSPQTRLRLDFGLRPAILALNEWAVPGLGGAFFVRQLTWSCMGLQLARDLGGMSAMRLAEGLEALAGWIVVRSGQRGEAERRIQGRRKFADREQLAFSDISERGAYVTVPFRRSATRALPGLGFCVREEARFRDLELSALGIQLAELALSGPSGTGDGVRPTLRAWIEGGKVLRKVPERLKDALLPDRAIAAEKALVRQRIRAERRRADLADRLHDFPEARLATDEGRQAFVASLQDRLHADRLQICFDFEHIRTAAMRATQSVCEAIQTGSRNVEDLCRLPEVADAFDALSVRCAILIERHVASVPDEAEAFCRRHVRDAPRADRVADLVGRAPALFAVNGRRVDRGLAFTGKPLMLAEANEPTEGEPEGAASSVPRPLVRLRTLLGDAGELA